MSERIEVLSAFIPMSIEKSRNDDDGDNWFVEGLASTPDRDFQGDIIKPDAIDYKSYFNNHGWITYEHGKDVTDIIGEPVSAFTDDEGFHIKGKLYKEVKKAQDVWNFQKAVSNESEQGRTLGFSIEGPIISRDAVNPSVITKVQIKNVTVTYHPANPNAKMEVATKSIDVGELGYPTNPAEMTGVGALQKDNVADAITLISYVLNSGSRDELLSKAQEVMSEAGVASDSTSALILQLGRGLSRDEAMKFVNESEG